jgi:hypothetical protein
MRGDLSERTRHDGYHEAAIAAGAEHSHEQNGGPSRP